MLLCQRWQAATGKALVHAGWQHCYELAGLHCGPARWRVAKQHRYLPPLIASSWHHRWHIALQLCRHTTSLAARRGPGEGQAQRHSDSLAWP